MDGRYSGQDGVVQRVQRRDAQVRIRVGLVALGLVTAGGGVTAAATGSAAAATCAATVTITGPNHGHLVLTPSAVKVQVGQCVQYVNSTNAKVQLTITQGSKTVYGPSNIAKNGSANFTPSGAGKDAVSASSQVLLIKFTGSGTVTATTAPSPNPSKSNSPNPTPKQSQSPGKGPHVASNPKHGGSKKNGKNGGKKNSKKTPTPHATGIN